MQNGLSILIFILFSFFPIISPAQSHSIYIRINEQLPTNDALMVDLNTIEDVLYRHFPILTITGSQLKLVRKIQSPGGWHYTFEQQIHGVSIYQGSIKANLNKKGKIISCMNTLKEFKMDEKPVFYLDEATLIEQISTALPDARLTIEPVFLAESNYLTPAYQVYIHDVVSGLNEERVYDAQSGELYSKEDVNAYYAYADTSGKGRVFIPNPCTKAGVAYGELFIDNEDAHSPLLESFMDTVVLNDLHFEGGRFYLEGPYVKVEDITMPNRVPAISNNGDFYFGRDKSGFEDVMAYYHIDAFQRYIQGLGFSNLQNRPFRVDTHASLSDNSNFVHNFGDSYIKFGEGGVDDAEDADVIIHEYGHALSYAATGIVMSGFERKALDEGIGDYFAASYSQEISTFDWFKVFNWDGHNEFWPGRDAATTNTYPPEKRDIYAYGEIWAASLMRIREEIGAEVTDRLVLQEMYSNANGMSMFDASMLLLDADSMLFNGAHTDVITFHTCQSNIRPQAVCLSVDISTSDEEHLFRIFPNPSQGQIQIEYPSNLPVSLYVYNTLGQKVFYQSLPLSGEARLEVNLGKGLYVFRFEHEGRLVGMERMVFR